MNHTAQKPKSMQLAAELDYRREYEAAHELRTMQARIAELEAAAHHADYKMEGWLCKQYPLEACLYPESKDWVEGDYRDRVELLHTMYESVKSEVAQLKAQLRAIGIGGVGQSIQPPVQADTVLPVSVPTGWKLVPVKHTLDMSIAFAETWYSERRCIDDPDMQDAWQSMIDAAPEAPAQPPAATDEPQLNGDAQLAHQQCRAVAHLARSVANAYDVRASMVANDAQLANLIGETSAAAMERLGDELNSMDSASETDDWLNPIFDAAQQRWPGNETDAPQHAAQQEPVAWRVHPFDCGIGSKGAFALTMRPEQVEMWKRKGLRVEPLYTAPQLT